MSAAWTPQSRTRQGSPIAPGTHQILAQTCPSCGLLLEPKWFGINQGYRRRICERCRGSQRRASGKRKANSQHSAQKKREYQALSLPGAIRNRYVWTEADMGVLKDPDLTLLEKALRLQRTYSATTSACHVNGFSSRVGKGDPMKERWVIENPSVLLLELANR